LNEWGQVLQPDPCGLRNRTQHERLGFKNRHGEPFSLCQFLKTDTTSRTDTTTIDESTDQPSANFQWIPKLIHQILSSLGNKSKARLIQKDNYYFICNKKV
jgi:hypothetical protein